MLDGSLGVEHRERWGWDRFGGAGRAADEGGKEGACTHYVPRRDLKDIEGWGEIDTSTIAGAISVSVVENGV